MWIPWENYLEKCKSAAGCLATTALWEGGQCPLLRVNVTLNKSLSQRGGVTKCHRQPCLARRDFHPDNISFFNFVAEVTHAELSLEWPRHNNLHNDGAYPDPEVTGIVACLRGKLLASNESGLQSRNQLPKGADSGTRPNIPAPSWIPSRENHDGAGICSKVTQRSYGIIISYII